MVRAKWLIYFLLHWHLQITLKLVYLGLSERVTLSSLFVMTMVLLWVGGQLWNNLLNCLLPFVYKQRYKTYYFLIVMCSLLLPLDKLFFSIVVFLWSHARKSTCTMLHVKRMWQPSNMTWTAWCLILCLLMSLG